MDITTARPFPIAKPVAAWAIVGTELSAIDRKLSLNVEAIFNGDGMKYGFKPSHTTSSCHRARMATTTTRGMSHDEARFAARALTIRPAFSARTVPNKRLNGFFALRHWACQ